MGRLRTYAPMNRLSAKVVREAREFREVYRQVDLRSEGRCEVIRVADGQDAVLLPPPHQRCPRRAMHHHHLFKPRRSNHRVIDVIHVCSGCHARVDFPFARGRLCYLGAAGDNHFYFAIRTASDKFTARKDDA